MYNVKDVKRTIAESLKIRSTQLALAAAGIASIGCVYLAGKTKGETTLNVNFVETVEGDNEHWVTKN
jgi:hypothetical protein